jgi:hypothetical protein
VRQVGRLDRRVGGHDVWGNSGRKFNAIHCFVNERLANFASTRYGLRGRGWATGFTYTWYRRLGSTDQRDRTLSDCLPDGERCRKPCAGEPHARFDRPLAKPQHPMSYLTARNRE